MADGQGVSGELGAFEALIDQSPFGILVVDADLRIRRVSAGASRAFGALAPPIGQPVAELLRASWPEPFATEALDIFRRTLETGVPYVSPGLTQQRRDVDASESYEWQTSRLVLPDGTEGVVCYFFDTTSLHQRHADVRESEERFREFTSATSDVVYRMNRDWTELRYLHGKEFVENTLEPSRTWLATYIPPEDQPLLRAEIQGAVRERRMFSLEHRVIRADGSIGSAYSRAVPVLDDSGAIIEWFGAATDVTRRKEAEAALSESEARYRTLFDSIDQGFCIIDMIYDGAGQPVDYRFVEVNPAFAKHTGLHDAAGKTVLELVPNHESHWFQLYGQVASSGEPMRFESRGESMHRTFDVYAFRLGGDGSTRVAVLFNDITARTATERALRESEERNAFLLGLSDALRLLVDPLEIEATSARLLGEHLEVDRAYYVELDESAGVARVNANYLRGESPSLVGHHRIADFGWVIPPMQRGELVVVPDVARSELVPAADKPIMAALRIGAHVNAPLVKGGTLVGAFCVTSSEPRQWPARDVVLVRETAERIWAAVERAKAERSLAASEEALREADRRKDEFLAMLAHELRNPLAPIRTGLELIRLAGSNTTAVERVRATMERQVGHMVRLIDDLLDVSRITSGKIQLQRTPTLLSDVVSTAVDATRAAFEAAGVHLTVNLPDTACTLDVDPTRMVQILANLLHNATKFTAAGGHVEIAAICHSSGELGSPGQLELRVVDDGAGISAEMLPRVFDLFVQGEPLEGRRQPGLGIGLALAKRLVEMHGGRIEVASEGLTRGSVFTIHLPIVKDSITSEASTPEPALPAVTRRVVVIDDNEDAACMMALLVKELGGDARVAYDGDSGVRVVDEFEPDVVLLDIGLPGMDGYETCRAIRRRKGSADVFIVALTGWGQDQDKQRALEAGFDAHLTKPGDPGVLGRILSDPGHGRAG